MEELTLTQQKILKAGKKEFLLKGYKDASLRSIVKEAGFTQGAFYGYYPDKASLFDELVRDAAEGLKKKLMKNQDTYFELFHTYRTGESVQVYRDFFISFIDYVYDHFDEFKLIVYRSEGTKYADYIYELIRLDGARSEEYLAELRRSGRSIKNVSHELHHMISSAYFSGIFEPVAHDMTREQARQYIGELSLFFARGWEALLK